MLRQRLLSLGLLMTAALGVAATLLLYAWHTHATALTRQPRLGVAGLAPGHFHLTGLLPPPALANLLLLRDFDGSLRVFVLPVREGHYFAWPRSNGQPELLCRTLEPDGSGNMLRPGGSLRCLAIDGHQWHWDYRGRPLENAQAPLREAHYRRDGDDIVLLWN